jgi:hypothetical protein
VAQIYESRVVKSNDGGISWPEDREVQTLEAPAPPDATPAQTVFMTPLNPDTLYAGGLGVLKSTDGGTTWRSAGLTRTPVSALAIDPEEPAIVYAGTARVSSRARTGVRTGRRYSRTCVSRRLQSIPSSR